MPDPLIQPDESGDVPRCRAECPSASRAPCCAKCIDCEAAHEQTEVGLVCQPRLLRAYAELRELKARRCDGCARGKRYSNGCFVGWCTWRRVAVENDDYCNGWERR